MGVTVLKSGEGDYLWKVFAVIPNKNFEVEHFSVFQWNKVIFWH